MKANARTEAQKAMEKSAAARRRIAAHLRKELDNLIIPVPPDGLCLYHVLVAARSIAAWLLGRDVNGWSAAGTTQKDIKAAKQIRTKIIRLAECIGDNATAKRLRKKGSAGYPGMDEMRYFAHLVNGRIELYSLMEPEAQLPMVSYGEGDLKLQIGHEDLYNEEGQKSEHFVLLQSFIDEKPHEIIATSENDMEVVDSTTDKDDDNTDVRTDVFTWFF